jgi:tetraacyldisaccharide 4'-kinase
MQLINHRKKPWQYLEEQWLKKGLLTRTLQPLSWIYQASLHAKRYAYDHNIFQTYHCQKPVWVIGNISVGGSGKTPLVIAMAKWLQSQQIKPAVIASGYKGSKTKDNVAYINPNSCPFDWGDEAVLLARNLSCPVIAGKNRSKACQMLSNDPNCEIILSDDGWMHWAMGRQLNIAVLDAKTGFGNALCLPAGPLREPLSALKKADCLIAKGEHPLTNLSFDINHPATLRHCSNQKIIAFECLQNQPVLAVAGIAHPQRFFSQIKKHFPKASCQAFRDHHRYQAKDLPEDDNIAVIMTEKDAIKCQHFAKPNHWFLPIEAKLNDHLSIYLKKQYAQTKSASLKIKENND